MEREMIVLAILPLLMIATLLGVALSFTGEFSEALRD